MEGFSQKQGKLPLNTPAAAKTAAAVRLSKKCLAEFAAVAANKVKSIFDRGVYLGENTYQAASVEFVRHGRTNYARSRLQKTCRKAPWGIFDSLPAAAKTAAAVLVTLGSLPKKQSCRQFYPFLKFPFHL